MSKKYKAIDYRLEYYKKKNTELEKENKELKKKYKPLADCEKIYKTATAISKLNEISDETMFML